MRKWAWIILLLMLGSQFSGCAHYVELHMPKEYQDKKLTEDPPGYQQDDKTILDNQK